ncbi:MAG: site-specific integrase [Rickettsiaceae bacterium]|nr:site-specific integrase [Rickettsiaceae bacterium]MDD9337147.1 site-specific integrase [Rickettsiaceae bacterium]
MNRDGDDLYDKKISAITREDIQKIFNVISNRVKYSANRFFELLRAVFNKAIALGLLGKNPAIGIEEHEEQARERYINTKEEMSRFIDAIKTSTNRQMADVFLLSLLTGARKSNVLSIKWNNINFEDRIWYIPAVQTKNRKALPIHLVEDAITMLARRKEENKTGSIWVFPSDRSRCGHLTSPKRAWKKICQLANIDELRIHDLRRTHGCLMRKAGADRELIGEALGHKDLKSTKIYDIIESDQVRTFREKAMKNLMSSKENKVTFQIETERANNNTEALCNRIEELEQQLRELKRMQG